MKRKPLSEKRGMSMSPIWKQAKWWPLQIVSLSLQECQTLETFDLLSHITSCTLMQMHPAWYGKYQSFNALAEIDIHFVYISKKCNESNTSWKTLETTATMSINVYGRFIHYPPKVLNNCWTNNWLFFFFFTSTIGWSWKICQLHFCWGLKLPPRKESFRYGTIKSDSEASAPKFWRNLKYTFIDISPCFTLSRSRTF